MHMDNNVLQMRHSSGPWHTAQQMKFSIKDYVTKSAVFFGFGHIYWRNP